MSVLIKGMEMPKDGELLGINIYPDGKVCINLDLDSKQIATAFPVPPHGRLIDADAMKDTDSFVHKTMLFGGQVVYSQEAIDNAPTIIPAEEAHDET